MREMHKNRQNSVDSITDICFHVGMDARKMKKHIQLAALDVLYERIESSGDYLEDEIGFWLDIDSEKVTEAKIKRFLKILDEMKENAESKI